MKKIKKPLPNHNINYNKKFKRHIIIYIIFYYIIHISREDNSNSISKIFLTIQGPGIQRIIYEDFEFLPNDIYINNNNVQESIDLTYNFEKEINNITLIWNYPIRSCYSMFLMSTKIIYIDLSHFNSSLVTDMGNMFDQCTSLKSINFNNFNTSLVNNIEYMFFQCFSLTSLNLNSFNTSSVDSMSSMFNGCRSLKSLNLDNCDTSLVKYMTSIFRDCNSLVSLNLKNFNTSLVSNMAGFFSGCSSLISLDLNSFDTSKAYFLNDMFGGCNSNLTISINEIKANNLISSISSFKTDCNNTCFRNSNHKLIKEKSKCIDSCINDDKYKYEYNNICYEACPNGTQQINDYLCEDFGIIESTNIITEQMTDSMSNNITPTDTSSEINKNNLYSDDAAYMNVINTDNIDNSDNSDNADVSYNTDYIGNTDNSYNIDYIGNTDNSSEYIKTCNIIELFNDICKLNNNNISLKDDIENNIKEELIKGNLDELIKELLNHEKEDLIIEYNNIKYEIITTNNNYNENKNISVLKLGECEQKLKYIYNIKNESLIIFKIDIFEEGLLIPIVEYELYDLKNKTKLNLNFCKDMKIELLYPYSSFIDENNEYKYNSSGDYYNDICYSFTTEKGTDIILSDRRNEFIDNNISLCEKNCEYKGYKNEIKKSICQCEIKLKFPLISEIKINKDSLLNNFININDITNLKVIKCYKELFTVEGLKNNIGNYILLVIIISSILSFIVFISKEYESLKIIICKIIFNKKIIYKTSNESNKKKLYQTSNEIIINSKPKIVKRKKNAKNKKYIKVRKKSIKNKVKNNPTKKKENKIFSIYKRKSNIRNSYESSKKEIINSNSIIGKVNDNKENILKTFNIIDKDNIYNDNEINSLSYKDAVKFDKRSFFEFYISLLKRRQIIIFTFLINNDYNSKSIKICLFLFSFALGYAVNVLFFTDSTMHKIYIDEGKYNFLYQIPIILYSTLITSIINGILEYLSLSEDDIIEIKNNSKDNCKIIKIKKCMNIKMTIYFLLNFIFLLVFWYYISCFGVVYKNTQIHALKDTLYSFGMSLLYPFGLCLVPGFFRIPSLREVKQNNECLYKFSHFLENIMFLFF